jgi:hypothetical protein
VRRFLFIMFGIICLGSALVKPVGAAGNPIQQSHPINWDRRDTAIYVVSTINLLHTRDGQLISSLLSDRYGVTRYDVYADLDAQGLYFIRLSRSTGPAAGVLAYQMGWQLPKSLSPLTTHLGVERAGRALWHEYRSDPRQLVGSFSSTLPQ